MAEPAGLYQRLADAATRGLGRPRRAAGARAAADTLEQAGVLGVGVHSTAEEIEEWERKLWTDQDELVEERAREWWQIILYVANFQHIAYHRDARRWVPKRAVPWRIRSVYNVMQKALAIRVGRLTENKPTVTVIAATTDRDDVERAEYKETLFWWLWNKLKIHLQLTLARRWATKCGSGFLVCGYDPDAGPELPRTKKRLAYTEQMASVPGAAPGPDGSVPQRPERVFAGLEEVYLDAEGNELAPVLAEEPDPADPRQKRKVRQDPPAGTDFYHEGEPFVEPESPFSLRFDKYTDDIEDSWYVQRVKVMPATRLLGIWPDALDVLKEATEATQEEKALQWTGLTPRGGDSALPSSSFEFSDRVSSDEGERGMLDRDYLVRETWVFPKNALLRKLWGREGAKLITIGGKLYPQDGQVAAPLPKWALMACPFVQIVDTLEEGNHYHKTILRDLLPLQDDINRTRSQIAERGALLSRLILGAQQGHQISLRVLGGIQGALLTYRSPAHKPEPLRLDNGDPGLDRFYEGSLAAAADVGDMNDASRGKLPSAGIAAKAIYALQYADERSIAEASALQDLALSRLARALDAICRVEFSDGRKIRIVGRDRSFMVEKELKPEHLEADVDYFFVPGSMLSHQKESIRNEMLELMDKGIMKPWEVRKYLPAAVPDAFRGSYDLQEAKVRRNLDRILTGELAQVGPDPWDDAVTQVAVLEEFMLTAKWDVLGQPEKAAIMQYWQALKLQAQPPAAPAPPGGPGAGPAGGAPAPAGAQEPGEGGQPIGAPALPHTGVGPALLAQRATRAMEPQEPNAEPAGA